MGMVGMMAVVAAAVVVVGTTTGYFARHLSRGTQPTLHCR